MSILVEFSEVSKSFEEKLILSKVSFKIKQGELTTLVGPNGAGKTTIARLLAGLETVSSGKIYLNPGTKISYLPQKLAFNTHLPIIAHDFLLLLAGKINYKKSADLLDFVKFNEIKNKEISTLSGGQFQKLALVATLMSQANLIILDEPTQSLDVLSQQEFYKLMDNVRQILDITVFIISHDLYMVMKSSSQVICLNNHICCSGRGEDIRTDKNLIDNLSSIGLYVHHHDHKH